MKATTAAAGALLGLLIAVIGLALPVAAATPPALQVSAGPFHDGQLISISVGPNHFFTPYSRVNVLECADPGGKKANLPTSVSTCDGNTIQGNTILVKKDGSFSEHGFQLFALPNVPTLGELPNGQPVCNQKKSCVLYVGQDQIHFTAPKEFSPPFTIQPSSKKS